MNSFNNLNDKNNQVADVDLLTVTEKIKSALTSRATNGACDNEEYKDYRSRLLAEKKIKNLIPKFLIYYSTLSEFWNFIKPKFADYKSRREYILNEFMPLIDFLQNPNQNPIHEGAKNSLFKLNSKSVHALWQKATERLNQGDLDGAITVAKTLIEDAIKNILNKLEIEYSDENDDLPKLYRTIANALNLSPNQHHEEIFKQILSGCQSIIQGMSALRNKMGDSHAQGKRPVKPAQRHAEFMVNLAGSMATFLVATWEHQSTKSVSTI